MGGQSDLVAAGLAQLAGVGPVKQVEPCLGAQEANPALVVILPRVLGNVKTRKLC